MVDISLVVSFVFGFFIVPLGVTFFSAELSLQDRALFVAFTADFFIFVMETVKVVDSPAEVSLIGRPVVFALAADVSFSAMEPAKFSLPSVEFSLKDGTMLIAFTFDVSVADTKYLMCVLPWRCSVRPDQANPDPDSSECLSLSLLFCLVAK